MRGELGLLDDLLDVAEFVDAAQSFCMGGALVDQSPGHLPRGDGEHGVEVHEVRIEAEKTGAKRTQQERNNVVSQRAKDAGDLL